MIPFSKIGCSSQNNIKLNDIFLKGTENDLSQLSADFTQPTQVKIEVKEKMLTIFIAGKKKYSLRYNDSMGDLVGLRFKFLGLGQVMDYKLFDENLTPIDF